MSSTTKRPPPGGRDLSSPTTGTSPSRTTRATTPSSPSAAGGSTPSRARSIRSSNPVTSRVTATQRRESPLAASKGSSSNSDDSAVEADEAARAATLVALEDLRQRLTAAETLSEEYQKKADVLQDKLNGTSREHESLEEKYHVQEEQMEALRNEGRESTRRLREAETIYEAERGAMVKEKEAMSNREEEMQTIIQRLNERLAQRSDEEPRNSRQINGSPNLEGGNFAPPAQLQRSDSRDNSKLIMQKDRVIESLRLEVAEAQIKLLELENSGGNHIHDVEKQLMEARVANARLMEDIESYQLLLQERTLNGDFSRTDFGYMNATQANEDALAALEGKTVVGGGSLADELSDAAEVDTEYVRKLELELRSQKDQNKALTLYINSIIERLLNQPDYEHILDKSVDPRVTNVNKDLPPPPKELPSGPTLLQRAKTMAMGNGPPATGKRPRPMSVMPSANSAHNNPETAPSIPIGLGRTQSTRRSRPMSEQFSGAGGIGAASVVNQMYKGSTEGGVTSPGLRSSQQFFMPPPRERNSSSNSVHTTSTPVPNGSSSRMSTAGNFPGMKSETSSTSGDDSLAGTNTPSGVGDGATTISTSPPASHHSSPPRNISGSHRDFKESTSFAGNKPRPLRLVQESTDAAAAAAASNKRQSWVGNWFSGVVAGASGAAAKKDEAGNPAIGDTIKE